MAGGKSQFKSFTYYWNKAVCHISLAAQNSFVFLCVWHTKGLFELQILLTGCFSKARRYPRGLVWETCPCKRLHANRPCGWGSQASRASQFYAQGRTPAHARSGWLKSPPHKLAGPMIFLTNFLCLSLLVFTWETPQAFLYILTGHGEMSLSSWPHSNLNDHCQCQMNVKSMMRLAPPDPSQICSPMLSPWPSKGRVALGVIMHSLTQAGCWQQCEMQQDLEALRSNGSNFRFGASCLWLRKEVTYILVIEFSLQVCAGRQEWKVWRLRPCTAQWTCPAVGS